MSTGGGVNPWRKQRKIARLPGAVLSPEVALASTLEKARAGKIKAVVIVIQWGDETMDCEWSSMKVSELAMAGVVMDDLVRQEVVRCDRGSEVVE